MRLITWEDSGEEVSGVLWGAEAIPFIDLHSQLPQKLIDVVINPDAQELLKEQFGKLKSGKLYKKGVPIIQGIKILPPIKPLTLRDAYTFREHVRRARASRGQDVPPEYDMFPVYYYSNPLTVVGPGDVYVAQPFWDELDFELELAIVIGKECHDIQPSQFTDVVFGLTIWNDFTARHIQRQEMKMNMGPHHGKEFASAMGPVLITMDELMPYLVETMEPGHTGKVFNLHFRIFLNGKKVSEGSFRNQTWTFGEVLARASEGVTLYPGEVFGSGTVGLGCLVELKQEGLFDRWLQPNDEIILEVETIGRLRNIVRKKT